tara:strand:- start:639 stop:815 length:177 start_codon:yes stop_codon:yes gene_type:complete
MMKKEISKMLLSAYQKKDWSIVAKIYENISGEDLPVPKGFTIDYDWRESEGNKTVKQE